MHADDDSVTRSFAGRPEARAIFRAILAVVDAVGPAALRVSKSQIAFRRRVSFAVVWLPGMYLAKPGAPLVLTVALHRRDTSPRWKEVVEPRPGRFTHHLELHDAHDVDDQVAAWLQEAWDNAG